MPIEICRRVADVRNASRVARNSGEKIALVPTMGGLHAGHLALVEKAAEISDFVIVSIFVNPTQFNNPQDLKTYPGEEQSDLESLAGTSTNLVFAPSAEEMYPKGFATKIIIDAASDILCDAHRPGHFDGVATVVAKLFTQCEPDYACFGEKDYQQLTIVKRLVSDLDLPLEIVPVETVREEDGLALSSRNARLSPAMRKIASRLNAAMRDAARMIKEGDDPAKACQKSRQQLESSTPFEVEYLEYRDGDNLSLLEDAADNGRIFAAAWLDKVRLIDNIAV